MHAARFAATRCGWAIERGHLADSLERAMAQILETDERMLGRIGLDIHDGPTQQLSVALLEVQLLEAELGDAEAAGEVLPDKLRPALGRIYEVLGGALHEMRELIGHLRPAQFESRTLPEILTDAVRAFEARGDAEATFSVEGDALGEEGITLSQRITFYRILQEALTNAHRHGHARSISVRLRFAREGTTLEVADDGEGFDVDAVAGREGTPRPRFGVVGMRDRANLLGGTIAITSAAGEGTLVAVYLPRWRPDDPAAFPGLDG
jgi:signal transduction histidine kinase